MKIKNLAAVLLTIFAANTYADKVTFDMAAEQDAAARANNYSVNVGSPSGGMSSIALESSGSGDGWNKHWSGSTTGAISVPRSAKEIFVRYTTSGNASATGYDIFPVNGGNITFAVASTRRNSSSQNHEWSCSTSASGTYSNYRLTGGSSTNTHRCKASVNLTMVMYR